MRIQMWGICVMAVGLPLKGYEGKIGVLAFGAIDFRESKARKVCCCSWNSKVINNVCVVGGASRKALMLRRHKRYKCKGSKPLHSNRWDLKSEFRKFKKF